MRKGTRRVTAAIFALGLVAAACGGDDNSSEETSAPTESEAPSSDAPTETEAPADGDEVGGLQGGTANQTTVDIGLCKQRRRVVGLDAAAVEDLHGVGAPGGGLQLGPQHGVHGLRLLG